MICDPNNPYDLTRVWDYIKELVAKKCPFKVTPIHPKRSLRQNNYLHLIIGYFASEYGCSMEEAKVDFFKRECNREIFERERPNKKGVLKTYLRSTKELDTAEMTTAIERFRNWASCEAEIYLPAPNEEQFLLHCQKIIEQESIYL